MQQIRNILQHRANGISIRTISNQFKLSRNTVRTYLRLIDQSSYTIRQALDLSDEALGQLLFETGRPPSIDPRYTQLQQKLAHYATELKNVMSPGNCFGRNIYKSSLMVTDIPGFAIISTSTSDIETLRQFSRTAPQRRSWRTLPVINSAT